MDVEARTWTWDHDVPLRWLLVDEYTGHGDDPDILLAACADIDGLFVEPPPPRARERYTLVGCEPTGSLREALYQAGTEQPWLGNILLDAVHSEERPPPRGCQRYATGCSCMEELLDVVVLDHRPSRVGEGLVDIDLEGHVHVDCDDPLSAENEPEAIAFRLTWTDEFVGTCRETVGVFRERPAPPVRPATLLGCRPESPLLRALTYKSPGRRLIQAALYAVDRHGSAVHTTMSLAARVTGSQPSQRGEGLLDITLDGGLHEPLPPGAREIWQLWHAGRPTERNLWAGYDQALRHEWLRAALTYHAQEQPDVTPGGTFHLDGRFVTDIEGFYCAIGEAVNGPGGYFGWNLDALDDCMRGRWGAARPFRLVWHHADVARQHLVPGYDRRYWRAAVTLQDLRDIARENGVEVDLR